MGVINLSAYKPVPGTIGDANAMANAMTALEAVLNGGVDNNNFAAGKIFDPAKIMQAAAVDRQGLVWDAASSSWKPGHQDLAYVESTAGATIVAAAAAAPTDVLSAGAVTFDGATPVWIEFFAQRVDVAAAAGGKVVLDLWEDATRLGAIAEIDNVAGSNLKVPVLARRKITPAAGAKTYSIKGWQSGGNGFVVAGTGVGGNPMPCYIRVTRH